MFIYYILVIIPFFLALLEISGGKTPSNSIYLVFLLFVFIVGGTNGNGIDWGGYFEQYSDFRNLSLLDLIQFEPGFAFLMILTGGSHVLLPLMAVACFWMVYSTIKKECKFVMVGVFIYIITMTLYMYMGVYRHAIAQSIIIFSWQYRQQNKKFILLLFSACLFHYSAIIGLLYYFIPQNKTLPMKVILPIIICGYIIRPFLIPFVLSITSFLPAMAAAKFDIYLNSIENGTSFSITYFAFKIFTYFVGYKYNNSAQSNQSFFLNSYAVSIILYLIISFSPSFGRLAFYYSCTEIILLPLAIYCMSYHFNTTQNSFAKKKKSIARPVFFVFAVIYFYTYTQSLLGYYEVFVPYKSILF